MKVKQISKPNGTCYDCVLLRHCKKISKGTTCGWAEEDDFKPWVESINGTHSWNQTKNTLREYI